MRILLLPLASLLLSACDCPPPPTAMKQTEPAITSFCERHIGVPQAVSLSELLTNGHKYEGRAVSVSGYYSHSFEYSALYQDAGTDIYARDFSQGIWVNGLSPFFTEQEAHVLLTGVYTQKNGGHLDRWPGSLCAVQRRPAS